jgi:hypothetical protein
VLPEQPLTGGNMTTVVRVGDTVRRASGPWTPTIHALLDHLHRAGFAEAPRAFGLDEKGREVLSYLDGTVPGYPLPEHVLAERTVADVARLLRRYHDITASFSPPADASWQLPAHQPSEVICHNDFAPYNLVWNGDALVGVIDFDLASPGPRTWDMAYTAYRFVPLTSPTNPDLPFRDTAERAHRLAAFCGAYGADDIGPRQVAQAAISRLCELIAFIVDGAAAADPAQQAVLARGDVATYRGDVQWLRQNLDQLTPSDQPT